MSEFTKNYQQQVEPENPKANKAYRLSLIIGTAIIAVAGLIVSLHGVRLPEKTSQSEASALEEAAMPVNEVNILGNYMVRLQSGTDTASLTGYVESDALGQIALYVLSAYAPKVYPLTINADGTVSNPELGQGKMSFRKASDKTTITFTNGIATCTLVK